MNENKTENEQGSPEALVGDVRREARRQAKEANPDKVPPEITTKTYMVIDDEKSMRTLVKNALQTFDIRHIHEATSVEDAVQILSHQTVDIILCDEEMPGMHGAEFVFLIRRGKMPVARDIPFIMITSHNEQEHIMLARKAGVDEFLTKPVSAAAVIKRIHSCVFAHRPFIEDEDGYKGPERRWLKDGAESAQKPPVKVFDFNQPAPTETEAAAPQTPHEPKVRKD